MLNLKTATRTLLKTPGFTAIAVATIAIGVGANAALFSLYDQLVLNPVTVPDPSSLVAIGSRNTQNVQVPNVSWPRYEAIRDGARSFASIGITAFDTFTLTGNGDAEQLNGQRVDAAFLPTLGVLPARGRNFTREEDLPNGPAVCIITHEVWQTRFGGRDDIIGQSITLNGQPWQVIGIMPPLLSVPFQQVHVFAPRVFEVTGLTPQQVQAGALYAQALGRLKPGVTLEQAQTELAAISRAYREQFGTRLDANSPNEAQTFVDALVGGLQPTFYTLLAAVGFVLLIACANVASLFLGRLAARQKEIAIRQSLGASRGDVVRQFLAESLVFSTIAGVLGALLAVWAIAGITAMVSSQLPPNTNVTLNWRALGFTAAVSVLSAFLVGLAPAWHASNAQVVDVLKDAARGTTARGGRFRNGLIIAEVALSVVLLVGSSLLLLSFVQLQRTSPGFEPAGAAGAVVSIPATRYRTPPQQVEFFTRLIEELRARPQVTDAAVAIGIPMAGFSPRAPYGVGGQPILPLPQRPLASLAIVSEDYFRLLRIGFAEGRAFTAGDRIGAPTVCIINESLARRLFPGQSALGKVILRGRDAEVANEIVGVIRDVKTLGVNVPTPDEIYYPLRQMPRPTMGVVVRTSGDAAALQPIISAAVASVDKDQPATFFSTLEANVAASVGTQRVAAALTAVFAAIALGLSAIGLYAVLAYVVSQRTAEIGIRMALGAPRTRVVALVLRSGFSLVGIGLGLGLIGAALAARAIQTLLFNVAPLDPLVYGAVAALFCIVAALACVVPSLRASRIDPVAALQNAS